MNFDDGRLKINKCPVCSSSHDYDLEINRKLLHISITPGTETDDYFTKMEVSFGCIGKDKDFVSEVSIPHRINERVLSVNTRPAWETPL